MRILTLCARHARRDLAAKTETASCVVCRGAARLEACCCQALIRQFIIVEWATMHGRLLVLAPDRSALV